MSFQVSKGVINFSLLQDGTGHWLAQPLIISKVIILSTTCHSVFADMISMD